MPYLVAGVVAAVLLLAELHWSQRLWFKLSAIGWWTVRAVVDACFAVILAGVLIGFEGAVSFDSPILLGVVAGLAGPRVFGRIALPVRERNFNPVNLAYRRAIELCDQCIDESSAEAQRAYVEEVIVPATEKGELKSGEIAEAFRQHLHGRRLMSKAERSQRLNFITEILNDPISENQKVAALVLKAWEIGAYEALRDVIKPLPRRRGVRASLRCARDLLRRARPQE